MQVADAVAHLLAGNEIDRTLLGIALERLEAGTDLLDEVAERAGVAPTGATGELADAVGRLEAVAHTDDLTGLHNRRSWLDTVRRELDTGIEGTLLICDIDNFKAVNDVHGHRAGDLVLAEVARVLARHGVAGRLGGDEFGVWVWGAEGPAGRRRRSSRTSSARSRSSSSRATPPLGLSIGIARRGGGDVMDLVEAADRDLPRARRSTR